MHCVQDNDGAKTKQIYFETKRALCSEFQLNIHIAVLVLHSFQAHLHCPRMTVWYLIARFGIRGPCFFEENITATVNAYEYCKTLENFLKLKSQ